MLGCAPFKKDQDPANRRVCGAFAQNSLGMFVIRTLEYLRKGGRIGLVEGVLGTMLQLKPVIYVNGDGVYETLAKARGHANALETLVREVSTRFNKARVRLAVVHGQAAAEAEKLLERLKGLLDVEESFLVLSAVLGDCILRGPRRDRLQGVGKHTPCQGGGVARPLPCLAFSQVPVGGVAESICSRRQSTSYPAKGARRFH